MARRASYNKSSFIHDNDASLIEGSLASLGRVITEQLLAMCPLSAEDWLALAWAPEEREAARIVSRAREVDSTTRYVGYVDLPLTIDPGPEWHGARTLGVASFSGVRYAESAGEGFLFPNQYKVSAPSPWAARCEAAASASQRLTAWAGELVNHHARNTIAFETLTRLLRGCGSLQEMRNWLPQTTTLLRMTNDPRCAMLADSVAAFRPVDHRYSPDPAMRQRINAVAGWIAGASLLYEAVRTTPTRPAPGQGLVEARYASFEPERAHGYDPHASGAEAA